METSGGVMCDVVIMGEIIKHGVIEMRVRLESASWELVKGLKFMKMFNDYSHSDVILCW